ncbi:MAG TPA: hypothetical protein VFT88_06415, partial [Acidobacteriaceae bacterium]|nr:hypothetical protein [Acidobacteriaceae bacterium]
MLFDINGSWYTLLSMAIRPESEKDFIIAIPPLRVRRIIALSAAAFFLSFIIATPFVVGLSR